jgi:hypothetical protein
MAAVCWLAHAFASSSRTGSCPHTLPRPYLAPHSHRPPFSLSVSLHHPVPCRLAGLRFCCELPGGRALRGGRGHKVQSRAARPLRHAGDLCPIPHGRGRGGQAGGDGGDPGENAGACARRGWMCVCVCVCVCVRVCVRTGCLWVCAHASEGGPGLRMLLRERAASACCPRPLCCCFQLAVPRGSHVCVVPLPSSSANRSLRRPRCALTRLLPAH